MNKLSKILIAIIALLTIALAIMTYLYFDMRKNAQTNLDSFLNALEQVQELKLQQDSTTN